MITDGEIGLSTFVTYENIVQLAAKNMAANFLQQLPKLPNLGKFHVPSKLYRPRKAVPEHQAMVQRQASMSLVAPHGLQNLKGENNCFLNSAIQVLWHIDVFRRSFRELEGHTCVGKSCIFCALKDLFTQFQHSDQTTIPPDVLRHALAECYREKHRFQLNLMDDAAECFEKLLEQVHYHMTGNDDLDSCGAPYCISHQCFSLNILERTECVCGATSEPLSFVQFVHYISSSALVKEAQKYFGPTSPPADETTPTSDEAPPTADSRITSRDSSVFGKVLHAASSYGEYRECPNFAHCKKNVAVKRILLNCPDIVCLGLIWDSDQPPVDDIMAVVNNIGLTLQLSDVFDTVSSENAHFNQFQLTAAIAYYGRHYSTFCLHSHKKEWIYFDDANFRTIGAEWSDVCEEIRKAHYQPLLLVYSNPFAEKIDVSQAPTEITRVYPHNRKLFPLKESAKSEEAESASDVPNVLPAQKETDCTNDGDYDHLPAIQHSTSANQSKSVTEAIDPLTLSIVPRKESKGKPLTPREDRVTLPNGTKETGWIAGFNSDNPQSQTPSSSLTVSTSDPDNDLMMFSITPAAVAKMAASSPYSGVAMQQPPVAKPDSSKAAEESLSSDLIEFSISPSLLGNAHNSRVQFGFDDKQQPGRQELLQTYPPKVNPNQSPHRASRSPELSHSMQITSGKDSPHQERYESGNASSNTSEYPQTVPQFQRQSSFPFQNKQPASLQSDSMKSEVQAVPQSSDFASRFRGYTALESDQLRPDWEYFATENTREDSSKSPSVSPEAWTVLNTAGDEEGTFKTSRSPESFGLTNEQTKYTPAITSLKRVSLHGLKHVRSEKSIVNRPLPSVPDSRLSHFPVDNGRDTLPLSSPTAQLSLGSSTARFSTQHYSASRGIGPSQAGSRTDSTSKKGDVIYVDPDELVFSKPSDSQPQVSHPENRHPYNTSNLSRGATNIAGPEGARKGNQRENFVGVVSGGSKGDTAPIVTLHDPNVGTKTSIVDSTSAETTAPMGDVGGSGSISDKPATYSSPPITADPLYAIPEKLKRKLLLQEAHCPSNTSAKNDIESTGSTTDTASSSGDEAVKAVDASTTAKSITGADYLSSLLQERQSARQQSSATATSPTGDLLEASTKAYASSHVETSLAPPSESLSQYDRLRPTTGKEYLQELLRKRQQAKSTQSSSVSGLRPTSTSASQPIGGDPLYAVPEKPKFKSGPTQTERHLNDGTAGRSQSLCPSTLTSTTVGRVRAPNNYQNRAQNVGNASGERISATVTSSLGPQKTSITSVMAAVPENIHSQILEARDLWAKAEASVDSDKTVAYMLLNQHNGIITRVLQDPGVRSNLPLYKYMSNIKEQGTKRAQALKLLITSPNPSASRQTQGACQRCGKVRNLDPAVNLCGPCKLRVQIGK